MRITHEFAVLGAVVLITVATATALFAQSAGSGAVYRLHTTGNVRLSVPDEIGAATVIYRNAMGKWKTLPIEECDGVLRMHISMDMLKNGQTMIVIDPPQGVDMEDQEPPRVESFEIDGKEFGPVTKVDLGGVQSAPGLVRISVADDLNALRTRTLQVSVNGRRYKLRDEGISFLRPSSKQGTIVIDVGRILDGMSADNAVTVSIDDYALDVASLTCSLAFRYTPPFRMEDGTLLSVDTVTPSTGWNDWSVVVDGVKMDSSYSTTAGYSWLSDATAAPHWIKMEFPQAREVSGVQLWWAYYETFRTSAAYEVQTWDGEKWATQVKIDGQQEAQSSRHEFAPVKTTAIRIWQPGGCGHSGRAEYMWLSELEVF